MVNVRTIYNKLQRVILGNYKFALRNGLHVGRGVSVMAKVSFGSEPYLITLEDNVRISSGVTFVTHDGGTWAFRDQPEFSDIIKYGRIHIGDRTFVGCDCTILPGVTVGKRCVIGAGSVVTRSVPDGCVVAGVPAKVIMTTQEYAEKCKKNMREYDKSAYLRNKKAYLQQWVQKTPLNLPYLCTEDR